MNAVRSNQLRAPAAILPAESSKTPDHEDYAFWAFDPRSPLSFLERVGLMLWLGGYGRDGFLQNTASGPRSVVESQLPDMDGLTLVGLVAVTAMLVFYGLEKRSHWFILAFAGSCVLGSTYGFLQGAWPLGLVEAVWSGVAIHRWRVERRFSTKLSLNKND